METILLKIRKFQKIYCQIFYKIENFGNFANKFSKKQKIRKFFKSLKFQEMSYFPKKLENVMLIKKLKN